ncbi:MAG: MarR family transcriptional regulator [Ilumatobacter sp.]|nr:MarR family transcriptional regulator [Ilumatobacter sp.]
MSSIDHRATPETALRTDPIETARRNWTDAGWADVADGMALVTSIMRVQQLMLGRVEAVLKPFELTFARFEVLMLLHFSSRGALPVGKIGERLQVHPASVTNAVQRLVAAGLVERSANPADARSVIASITPSGRERVLAAAARLNAEVFGDVGVEADDHDALFALLADWRAAHGDFRR